METRFLPECIFMDVDTIEIGANVRATIHAAVLASDVLIAVIGKSWASVTDARGRRRLDDAADWVRVEIATALQAGIVVIPVLVDDARMPAARSLPDDLAALLDRNAFEIRNTRFAADVNKFLDALTVAARRVVDARPARSPAPPTPRKAPFNQHWMGADSVANARPQAVHIELPRSPTPAAASDRVAAPLGHAALVQRLRRDARASQSQRLAAAGAIVALAAGLMTFAAFRAHSSTGALHDNIGGAIIGTSAALAVVLTTWLSFAHFALRDAIRAVELAPERVRRLVHSSSTGLVWIHSTNGSIAVKAEHDGRAVLDALVRRCPAAAVERDDAMGADACRS
jgi:hypothetical protein